MKVLEITDDAVYIQHRQLWSDELNKPLYDTIDWLQLAKQKMELIRVATAESSERNDHPLDGLIALLDAIQDDADAKGYPVVWAYNADEWHNGEIEIEEYKSE